MARTQQSIAGSKRLTPQEKHQALFLWHLYNGNASKVAKDLHTTRQTIARVAKTEDFDSKAVLIQEQLMAYATGTKDPQIQSAFNLNLKMRGMTARLLQRMEKYIKKRKLFFKDTAQFIAALNTLNTLIKSTEAFGDASSDLADERRHPGIKGDIYNHFNFIGDLKEPERVALLKRLEGIAGGEFRPDNPATRLEVIEAKR